MEVLSAVKLRFHEILLGTRMKASVSHFRWRMPECPPDLAAHDVFKCFQQSNHAAA